MIGGRIGLPKLLSLRKTFHQIDDSQEIIHQHLLYFIYLFKLYYTYIVYM